MPCGCSSEAINRFLGVEQVLGQTFADCVVQAAMVFEHGRSITSRDFIDVHGDFDDSAIQRAQSLEELIDVADSDALGPKLSPWLFLSLRHRIAPVRDSLIAHLGGEGKRKQLIRAITGLGVPRNGRAIPRTIAENLGLDARQRKY